MYFLFNLCDANHPEAGYGGTEYTSPSTLYNTVNKFSSALDQTVTGTRRNGGPNPLQSGMGGSLKEVFTPKLASLCGI